LATGFAFVFFDAAAFASLLFKLMGTSNNDDFVVGSPAAVA
jgi:hypothetical protein